MSLPALNSILNLNLSPMEAWSTRNKLSIFEEAINRQQIREVLAVLSGNDLSK